MSAAVKPELRRLLHNQIKKNLLVSIGLSIVGGIAYTLMVNNSRKELYMNFYNNAFKLYKRSFMNIYKYEVIASFILWSGAVFYSIYGVIKAKKAFQNIDDVYGDFQEGWLIKAEKKDVADYEWESAIKILNQIYPWLLTHIVVSECLRQTYFKVLPYWQFLIAILFIIHATGVPGVIITVAQPIVFECISKFKSKVLIWICAVLGLIFICYFKSWDFFEAHSKLIEINKIQHYMIAVVTCWINLRCLGYYLDGANSEEHSFISPFSYCFYLPTLFLGPFMPFSSFRKSQKHVNIVFLIDRIKRLFCDIIHYGFWFIFTEFALHYVYINALSYQPQFVESLDNWSLYGYGYCMGQFFHLKYVVLYGLSISLSKFEHIDTPSTPKCIGRIHLYSDMWKYFDGGLYKFLIRYIYLPTLKTTALRSKLFSSFLCFLFVYVWHGIQSHILVWATLNFIGVSVENVCANFFTSKQFVTANTLNENWKQRLLHILTSLLLAMSAVSNFYFFAGMKIGNIFFARFIQSSLYANLILLFFLCCCCYVSTEVKKWETCVPKKMKNM